MDTLSAIAPRTEHSQRNRIKNLLAYQRKLSARAFSAKNASPVPNPYPTSPGTAMYNPTVMARKNREVDRSLREMAVWTYIEQPESLRDIYEATQTPYKHRVLMGILVDDEEQEKTLLNVLCGRGWHYSMCSDPVTLCIGLWRDRKTGISVPRGTDTKTLVEDISRIWYKTFESAGKCCHIDLRDVYKPGSRCVRKLYKQAEELGVFEMVETYLTYGIPAEDLVG